MLWLVCFVDRASQDNLFQMKPTSCTLFLSIFISTFLHVSGNYVPIIKRTYCIYATLVFFTQSHPYQQTRQPPSLIPTHQTATQSHPNQHTRQPPSLIPTNTPHSHPVSSQPTHQTATQSHPNQHTRQTPIQCEKYQCHTDTVSSPDDGHIVVRNM